MLKLLTFVELCDKLKKIVMVAITLKKYIALIFILLTFSTSVYAYDIHDWVKDDFKALSSCGILFSGLFEGNMTDNITRRDFCELVMNLYTEDCEDVRIISSDYNVFSDTKDVNVLKAYKAGIISGKGDGIFDPDGYITRQEIGVILSRVINKISIDYNVFRNQVLEYANEFCDCLDTAEWAIDDMSAVYYYGVINGVGNGRIAPLENTTKEQAICMVNRVKDKFAGEVDIYPLPQVKLVNTDFEKNTISLSWNKITYAGEYDIIIKGDGINNIIIQGSKDKNFITNYPLEKSKGNKYTVYICAKPDDDTRIFSEPMSVEIKKAEEKVENKKEETQIKEVIPKNDVMDDGVEETEKAEASTVVEKEKINLQQALSEKEIRVFPDGYYFADEDEAAEYMTEVCVPVWHLNDDGTKTQSKKYITVNKALAEDVVSIFTEIFNDSSQFPVKDVGGYYWRNTAYGKVSQHSYGTCIDINYNENYYVEPDGTPVVGSYWKPGEDPYSIAEDSIVVKTFAKYGWLWGGNAWGPSYNKDYMHFTYLGK
ncbi:MAG: M15 family metallopeptidase [Clostridia bacterium]|nr:M15 family metallopeptidase [Clostridia bacterium]